MEQIGKKLLDFSSYPTLDVTLLDQVVLCMNNPSHPEREIANQIMMALQEHPDAWTKVNTIINETKNPMTQFFGLKILEDTVRFRWKILPPAQKEGIKEYIIDKLISLSKDEALMHNQRTLISKFDLILVHILKHEWPQNWPTFITDIVESSKQSQTVCENNMQILKLLSEEVFDFSKDSLTGEDAKNLKNNLTLEFTQIYQLCEFVLENSTTTSLIIITLKTLLRFITWIPLGYLFETKIINLLLNKFFLNIVSRNDTLSCLTEIVSLKDIPSDYQPILYNLYLNFLSNLSAQIRQKNTYVDANGIIDFNTIVIQDEILVQRLSIFFTTFFRNHLQFLETNNMANGYKELLEGFGYLVSISEINESNDEDSSIFKICLDYYHFFTKDLYDNDTLSQSSNMILNLGGNPLIGNKSVFSFGANQNRGNSRKLIYEHKESVGRNILPRIRNVMINKMVKPSEVLVVEDENGEIVRETTKDTEVMSQYRLMHESLVYLTHLNYENTEQIMLEKLSRQVDGTDWSWNKLNTLCWAIGSISGAMSDVDEKPFLVTVIKDLLGLCEMKRGKDNKAVIASNIMYVVGNYPRFLRQHWKFLKTVTNKLIEFMHELHPGVQDMACDTFLKIAVKCKKKFVTLQTCESEIFVSELIANIPNILTDLQTHQIHVFYQAMGAMLQAIPDNGVNPNVSQKEILLSELMTLPNNAWKSILEEAAINEKILYDTSTGTNIAKELVKIVKTNNKVCGAMGSGIGFFSQMRFLFNDMMNIYKAYTNYIQRTVNEQGQIATKSQEIRCMRQLKREIIQLIQTFIETSIGGNNNNNTDDIIVSNIANSNHSNGNENEYCKDLISQHFLPDLLMVLLHDYKTSINEAKESDILLLMATIINTLKKKINLNSKNNTNNINFILSSVFECTLNMISKNFLDFPEHRVNFFILLKAVNTHCFEALFSIPLAHQKLVVDAISWAFKHTERTVADTGLETLNMLLNNVQQSQSAIGPIFYENFYLQILTDVLCVLTDRLHKSGFKMHSIILKHMFYIIETNQIQVPLYNNTNINVNNKNYNTNQEFLRDFVTNLITTSFPNLSKKQIFNFINGLFDIKKTISQFKDHLRDFIINIKEFSEEDNTELYLEENKILLKNEQEKKIKERLAVPGLLMANEKPDDMDDL